MQVKNNPYYLGFSYCYGIGPVKYRLLKNYFGSVERAYHAKVNDLVQVLGPHYAISFDTFRQRFNIYQKYEELIKKKITVLGCDEKEFPPSLRVISDPPICLYVKGDCNSVDFINKKFFGIVGTRTPTSYGQEITHEFASHLSKAGFIIVSGMALGIDAIAHWSTLSEKGKTVAVLGCGVDVPHPRSNMRLYEEIIDHGGVVISEFPPGMFVQKGLFVARNRIISGLSLGILVVEGAKDSGALITARYAAEQGKDVFAPPVPITSVMSQAPNILIKQGAKFVTQVEDILEEYGIRKSNVQKEVYDSLSTQEKTIVDILKNESMNADKLSAISHKQIHHLLGMLSLLEMKGVLQQDNRGDYHIKSTRE